LFEGAPPDGFDPISEEVRTGLRRLVGPRQLAVFAGVSEDVVSHAFHETTPHALGVLASPGNGLKRDLSLQPDELGPDFEAYMDYGKYLSPPDADPVIEAGNGDLRRRYRITPPLSGKKGEISFSVAPIMTDFYMLFGIHKVSVCTASLLTWWQDVTFWVPAGDVAGNRWSPFG
jgi:hypothetical protein